MVHVESFDTIIQTLYLPFGTATPEIVTSRLDSSVVASFAPGVHTSSQFTTRVPHTFVRPRKRGRE